MIKKLLATLFLVLVQIAVSAQTNTYTGLSGSWNTAANWSLGLVPTASHDVVIPSGKLVTVFANALLNNLSILGTGELIVKNNITITIYGNVTVDSGAKFSAGEGNNDSAIVKVYGNFINQGAANFYKSIVIIGGNLITASTILQNNGNVVVGGNVSGVIGGSGSGTVYPTNPNAIVITTGSADEKPAGTLPTDSELVILMNEVIYGGSCPFTISAPANSTTCSGSNVVFTSSTSGSSTAYKWQVNAGSGWVDLNDGGVYSGVLTANLTIIGVVTSMNGYKFRNKVTISSCTKNGNYGVLNVNTAPSIPMGLITQPNCIIPTGSVQLTGLPITGTWTLVRCGSSVATITGSGSSFTVTGLAAGTYSFTVSNGSCTSGSTVSMVINPTITTTYTGSSWSTTPTVSMTGVINSNIPIATNVELCSCTVNTGIIATVASGVTLKIQDKLTVNGTGTLTFEDGASLVQINNVVNVGNIRYKRLTTPIRNTDYTYWSSPVLGFTLGGVSPRTLNDKFYSYEVTAGSEDWKQESAATIMAVGKGYIARGPETTNGTVPWPIGQYLATFTGVPNNGNYSLTGIFPDKSYLIGNPYPSALDANTFLTVNSGVLDGTLYFWTHNTSIGIGVSNPGTGVFAYSGDDYASYNLTGGTATAAAPSDTDKTAANPYIPTGKIAAGQSFFASSKVSITGSSILFDNSMRVGVGAISGTNSQFFRTNKNSKTATVVEQNRVWLNMFNNQGAFKQALVGYVTGATNNYDNGYDGETYDANEFVDFYSVNQEKNLVIQGRALPFDENDEVQLGFRSSAVGNFNIGIDQTDGILKTRNIFVEDKVLNIVHDLKTAPYAFTTQAGTFNDRFVLRFTQKTLGIDGVSALENTIIISKYKNELKIKSETETIERITVFDILGRKIFEKQSINSTEFRIVNNNIIQQILIVKLVLVDGNVITKKIM